MESGNTNRDRVDDKKRSSTSSVDGGSDMMVVSNRKMKKGTNNDDIVAAAHKSTTTTTTATTTNIAWDSVLPILVTYIPSYYDSEECLHDLFSSLSLVSKHSHHLIRTGGLNKTNLVIPVLEITASKRGGGSTKRLLEKLRRRLHKTKKNTEEKVAQKQYSYCKLKFTNAYKFTHYCETDADSIANMAKKLPKLYGITVLEFSEPTSSQYLGPSQVVGIVSSMLPNVQQIDITNSKNMTLTVFEAIGKNCPLVEKITWNNKSSQLSVFDYFVRNYQNAKDICLDNSIFICVDRERDKICDLERHPAEYMFCNWESNVLERLSIKNVRLGYDGYMLPQNAVIKFVRNAPTSLRWFRSDLSHENIQMLRSERPEIELIN